MVTICVKYKPHEKYIIIAHSILPGVVGLLMNLFGIPPLSALLLGFLDVLLVCGPGEDA